MVLVCTLVECAFQNEQLRYSRKQGNRLRILMLLGWPCLSATPQDQTMKYMGHLLICHIINQFNINRKIVLQVNDRDVKYCK